ncbi:hypothetical protein BOTBODRAFT_318877 [Botryobasidium botryosum FD-172 SS1]|uniref:Uncharacterized protein n=1 Tax=Botryobasidium botryosum (strain FD-172 SS1) TaxID=930990 RepID=A0A067N1I3_BOTB1|nr:hypothetical protein BOTBODRAFT_318877 [Botryobasidium botryosum FD-172 SS1]
MATGWPRSSLSLTLRATLRGKEKSVRRELSGIRFGTTRCEQIFEKIVSTGGPWVLAHFTMCLSRSVTIGARDLVHCG